MFKFWTIVIHFLFILSVSHASDLDGAFVKDEHGNCLGLKINNNLKGHKAFNRNSLEFKYCKFLFNADISSKYYFKKKHHGLPAYTLKSLETSFKDNRNLKSEFFLFDYSEEPIVVTSQKEGIIPGEIKGFEFGIGVDTPLKNDFVDKMIDWEFLLELNNESKNLWDTMISEIGVKEARHQYFNKKKFSKNRKTNKMLLESLNDLKVNIDLFMQSSEVVLTYGLSRLKNYHPLFIQILVEKFALEYPFRRIRADMKMMAIRSQDYYYIEHFMERHLFPDKKHTYDPLKYVKMNEEVSGEILRRANILGLLTTVLTENSCESFGLRPELTRAIIQGYDPIGQDFVKTLENNMRSIVANKCGKIANLYDSNRSPYFVIYSSFYKNYDELISKYRRLSEID